MQDRVTAFAHRIVDQTVIDADGAVVVVQIIPAQSKSFSDSTTRSQ